MASKPVEGSAAAIVGHQQYFSATSIERGGLSSWMTAAKVERPLGKGEGRLGELADPQFSLNWWANGEGVF